MDVKEFTLKNGMLFWWSSARNPQVAVRLAIRAGSALEETGKTGIAHMLEHMMFKGTGTSDRPITARMPNYKAASMPPMPGLRRSRPGATRSQGHSGEARGDGAAEAGSSETLYPQVFSSQLGKNGAVGVNAFTTTDQTSTLLGTSDMLEQWFSIISEQLFEPSWREFYVEKEVVQREWAFRYVNNPEGAPGWI